MIILKNGLLYMNLETKHVSKIRQQKLKITYTEIWPF